ncbi:ABC transporter permease [Thalassococcus sp. S3]|uniref:ABC transporter permease n=1 Tax=Thalassococcus sp. S3 TaxID=2017482 RepID=UPI0010247417|nr:ABC transporter permease [Thalassococcus sp. S3]QBF30532.1 peptide ABC transporter permease [Thalassococcus sp. S3]
MAIADPDLTLEGEPPLRATLRRLRQHKGAVFGGIVVGAFVVLALFAPLLAPYDYAQQDLSNRLAYPVWAGGSWDHPFGTDHLGRDYLSRLLYGTQISVIVGFGASIIGCVIGVFLGVTGGYFGGRVDQAVSFLLSCQLAMPTILLGMALVFLIGPSTLVVICVIGVLHWNMFLVVTRAATMRVRELEFVTASRALGASDASIIRHDILPNVASHIIVILTYEFGKAILAEATLSFLGVGVPAPTPSWGLMIAEGKNAMFFQPWLVIIPGAALFLLVIAVNLMGDGLRDVTAPEARR